MNDSLSKADLSDYSVIPTLKNIIFNEWNIIGENNLINFLSNEDQVDVSFNQAFSELILVTNNQSSRRMIDLNTVTLTGAIFPEKKEIRLYTLHLGNELFFIQEMARVSHPLIDHEDYKKYLSHVELAAGMDINRFPSVMEEVIKKYEMADLDELDNDSSFKSALNITTSKLLETIGEYNPKAFERVSDYALGLTAKYALIRIHLLKFVAILPSLYHDKKGKEIKRMLLETLRRLSDDSVKARFLGRTGEDQPLPIVLEKIFWATFFFAKLIPSIALAQTIRFVIRQMAKRFIAGESISKVSGTFKELKLTKREATLDQLGELVVSEKEADQYQNEVLSLIHGLGEHYEAGEKNKAQINRSHVSIKVSALCSDFKPEAYEYTKSLVAPRLKKILLEAKKHKVFVNIDAEHYDYRDLVFKIYRDVLLESEELKEFDQTGIVLQAYLRDAYTHLQDIIELAKQRDVTMPVRLVKGAYWDAETVEAQAHSFNAPEFLNKEETDINFRCLIVEMLKSGEFIQLCLASHNFGDHAFCEVLRQKRFPNSPVIEHQCLHMTYEALSTALSKMGWATRNYMPVGSLLVGMAYLVRRIMENSSQVGVLTIMRSHKNNVAPATPQSIHQNKKVKGELVKDRSQSMVTHHYFPISPVRLYLENHFQAANNALNAVKEMGPLEIKNLFPVSGEIKKIFSNSDLSVEVGQLSEATIEDVDAAVEMASKFYNHSNWSDKPSIERGKVLLKVAEEFLVRRLELSAFIVKEAGKTMEEALADVDEAIDFLHFYAREQQRFLRKNPTAISRGVLAVVTPWNFPLAIPCGMISSALVAGNTVILKSAEQTPIIASLMVESFHRHGCPKEALIHLPGDGETVGDKLVNHPLIAGVVFTGSKSVGLYLAHTLGKRLVSNSKYNEKYPSKVITEMGGKNAIIVTANAELDETVSGILKSAFAHSGQKCSAASRVLVHESILEPLKLRLKQAVMDLNVGEAWRFDTFVNPIVSLSDRDRLRSQIKAAGHEAIREGGEVLVDRSQEELPGTCVGPAVFVLPKKQFFSSESYSMKELFGPVVHLTSFENLDEALEIFNTTEYALTGGIFSQSQDDIDYLVGKMLCGNLYVNRTITGARVGIEPFGGFKLSGTGPKAGSPKYIEAFHVIPPSVPLLKNLTKFGSEDPMSESREIMLSSPSDLPPGMLLARVQRGVKSILTNFEFLYQGIYGESKSALYRFNDFLENRYESYALKNDSNVYIPGQISVRSNLLSVDRLLVISYEPRAYISSLMSVISALVRGVGVSVVCRNDDSFFWWSKIVTYFRQAGISSSQIRIQQISRKALKDALESHVVTNVLVDGKLEQFEELTQISFNFNYTEKEMIKFYGPFDAPSLTNAKGFLDQFSLVRSFAINTMRHGAPLELDI
jgi:RHH-type transcriptional regulator, proline utilization regulon repressor / proline dehydrogenase / delta 1-pyrroline-5-carboxylate dehydrogenase